MSRLRLSVAALVFVATGFCFSAGIAGQLPVRSPLIQHDGWPQLLRDATHSSVSPDQKLAATTGPTIGLNWMSPLRATDLGGPVAAWNATAGMTVAYVGDERGDVSAFNEANGTTLWSTSVGFGDALRSTPMVAPDGSVWAGTVFNPTVYKLDGATGNKLCSLKADSEIDSSIMFATPRGGVPMVYTATVGGYEIAVRESDCKLMWSFNGWVVKPVGAWATPVFGVDVNGNPRVYVGSATQDDAMYAVDALTGKLVWRYSAYVAGDNDIGSAATVSLPGNNGFADGVLYFHSKAGILLAVDLTTGKLIWQYNYAKAGGLHGGGISSTALYKTMLVYGVSDGAEAVDARTGKLLWHSISPSKATVYSSPAVAGPPGNEIVTFGDLGGAVRVLRLVDGKNLYDYQTGNYITASPAIVNGHILISSSDGFLYDFTTAGGNASPPATTITSPTTGSKVANPDGTLTVSGAATDATGLTEILVSVQSGGPTGPWYDGATGTWVTGAYNNFVPVKNYNGKQSTWSFAFPVPPSGSNYVFTANAVNIEGAVDRTGAQSSFTVTPNPQSPQITLSASLAPPGSTIAASASGFAAGEIVSFTLQGQVLGSAKATANGTVRKIALHVPLSVQFGPSTITATGQTSQKTTTAPIDITNVWNQSGYSAAHTGYEPHDSILSSTALAGYLSRAWTFMTGAPVTTSPAIVGGSAYVGNAAGTLSAVDTESGAPFWTYTISTNAPIHAAPAVGNGDVIFGADDHSLYRLAAASGTLLGSIALDGVPTSPALVSGTIYVGTSNGTAYAIDEASGTQVWSTNVGASISQPLAVDVAGGAVIVADDSGHLTTLNPSSGAQLRQTTTGGASVTVAPTISGGKVLVGAADGILRAFDEQSDNAIWSYNAGAPIRGLAADGTNVYAGNDAGALAELVETSGKPVSVARGAGSAIVGLSYANRVAVADTMQGSILTYKAASQVREKFEYKTGAALTTQPAIVDGAIFVGAGNGGLYAFTSHGQAPQTLREHRLLLELQRRAVVPARWSAPAGRAVLRGNARR